MTLKNIKLLLIFIFAFLMIFGQPDKAVAEKSNALYYVNNGRYVSQVRLHWKHDGEKYKTQWLWTDIKKNYIVKIPLPDKTSCDVYACQGDEVWLEVQIILGDKVSCKKSINFIAAKNQEFAAVFHTGGQTLTNNRCRIFYKKAKVRCNHNSWPQKKYGCTYTTVTVTETQTQTIISSDNN